VNDFGNDARTQPPLPPTTVYHSLFRRIIRALAWAWTTRPGAAAATPEEARLRDLVETARLRIGELERRIFALTHDVRSLESEKKILGLEVEKLCEVATRDRQRVAAEQAGLATAIAKAVQPPVKPEGGQYGL